MRGVQQSWGIQDRQQQQQQLQAQQQQAQMQGQQQQQMQQELAVLSQKPNPSASDYIRITTKYPELSAKLKDTMGAMGEEQKQNKISTATQVVSALQAGRTDIAKDILAKQKEAALNSGNSQEAQGADILSRIIDVNPGGAKTSALLTLASAMGDKFSQVYDSISKTPLEAQKLGIENANAPIKNELENQNLQQDVEGKKLKRQLDVLDAQIRTADSETKRNELMVKRDQLNADYSEKQAAKAESAQGSLAAVESQLETVNKALSSPQLTGWDKPGSFSYKARQLTPFANEAKDYQALLDTVGSQQVLGNLMELKKTGGTLGQVSEKELEVLKAAKASLTSAQSAESLERALKTIKGSLERVQRAVIAGGKLPTTANGVGGAFVMNHPKFGTVNEAFVNKLLEQHPGATREQVLTYLESSGGK